MRWANSEARLGFYVESYFRYDTRLPKKKLLALFYSEKIIRYAFIEEIGSNNRISVY